MVHQMSGEPESVILSKMPYARALQYQNEWYILVKGIVSTKPNQAKGTKMIL